MGLRERKKADTRQRLVDAAFELFVRHGYDDTTVEMIAEAAAVSSRTFFRYFDTKDAVLGEPGFRAVELLIERLEAAGVRRPGFEDVLTEMLSLLSEGLESGELVTALRAPRARPELLERSAGSRYRWISELAAGLARLDGRQEPTFSERTTSAATISLAAAAIDEWVRRDGTIELAQLTHEIVETLRSGRR